MLDVDGLYKKFTEQDWRAMTAACWSTAFSRMFSEPALEVWANLEDTSLKELGFENDAQREGLAIRLKALPLEDQVLLVGMVQARRDGPWKAAYDMKDSECTLLVRLNGKVNNLGRALSNAAAAISQEAEAMDRSYPSLAFQGAPMASVRS